MNLKAVGYSDKGIVRSDNQDNFLVHVLPCDTNKNSLLAIVADGVGGAKAGSIASMKSIEVIRDYNLNDHKRPQLALKRALEAANREIYTLSNINSEYQGMATTCSVLMIKGHQVFTGHVGDSRIYRIRNNQIQKLTEDHTLPMKLLKNGDITASELEDHPQSHVLTQALGSKQNVDIHINSCSLEKDDIYILCSDGLYKYFTDDELMKVITKTPLDSSPEKLVAMANERGGSDNITVIIVNVNSNDVSKKTVRITGDFFKAEATEEVNNIRKNVYKYIIAVSLLIAAIVFLSSRLK